MITTIAKSIGNYFKRQANRTLFLKNLDTLVTSLDKRQEVLTKQLHQIEITRLAFLPIAKIQFFQIAIMNSMGHKHSFESFFVGIENFFSCKATKRLRNKAFVKVWENMANIEFWENHMYEEMGPAQAEINRITENMGKPLEQMRIYYTELFNNPTISIYERNFVDRLQNIVTAWANQNNSRNAYVVNEHLTKNIKLLCDEYSTLPLAIKMRNICMSASYWYDNLEIVIQSLQRSLIEYGHTLRYFSRSTEKIIKILK